MACSLQTSPEVDLPLIDLSPFSQTSHNAYYNEVIANVRHACQEWGFFRVFNHGIPQTLLQEVELALQQLFAMPEDVKQKAREGYPIGRGVEIFNLAEPSHSDSILEMSRKIWPQEGNPFFCKTIRTYALLLEDLARTITKIILASLDLDVENYYQSDFQNCPSAMRMLHYTSDGTSVDDDALVAHTDIGVFTILYQDNKGGLQIKSKEGMWLNVKPLPDSFVINVADCFKAWCNGRYRSAEHRVVYNGWADRISVGYFVRLPDEKEIWAPAELVDEQHPRRYRAFTLSQLKQCFRENLYSQEEKATLIDKYAGVWTMGQV